uniref:Cytochrome P450 n=1 Tax=Oryza barthii TaxID=65489 RepID=A0A0D3FFM4_9ORYZ
MAAILLLLLVFLVSVALVVRTWSASRRSHEKARYATAELRPYPLVGHLPQFLANRHRILDWMTEVLSRQPTRTFVLRRPGGVRGVITANPANVERFLRSGFDNYPKGERFASLLHDFLGRGIFNADGEAWRSQRKPASYEFNTGGGALAEADDGSTASGRFADAFRDAANLSAGRFRYAVPWFWRVKKALHIGSERRLRESIAIVHDFADRIIRSRREEIRAGLEKHDLLSRFMASHDESYTEVALRDVVISFLLAGRETTSSALTWFFWLLSSRPDVERRIREEVATVRARRGDGDVDRVGFDLDELREMQYVHAAITESMRLYPPVPVDSLHAQEDDVLPDGTAVEAGWFVAYNSYAMGRMESVWGKDAAEFRAERWLEDAAAATFRPESPFRYVSFHGGPRVCLGKEMAYIQMKSIIACVLQELELAVDGAYRPRQVTSLTLRMADGLPTRVKVRGN